MRIVIGSPAAAVFAFGMVAVAWPFAVFALVVGAWLTGLILLLLPVPVLVLWSRQVVVIAGRRIVTFWPAERFRRGPSLTFAARDDGPAWVVVMEGAGRAREMMHVPSPWWTSHDRMRRRMTEAADRLRTACET